MTKRYRFAAAVAVAVGIVASAVYSFAADSGPTGTTEQALLGSSVYVEARGELDENRFDDAVKNFETLITVRSPLASYAQYWQGVCFQRQGRRSAAVDAFLSVTENYPDSPAVSHAQLALADIYTSNKTYQLAVKMYRSALSRIPSSIDTTYCRFKLAQTIELLGDRSSALTELRLVPSPGRTPPDFLDDMVDMMVKSSKPADRLLAAEWLYSAGRYTDAANICAKLIGATDSLSVHVRRETELLRGKSMSRAGQAAKAADLLHKVAETWPGTVTASQAMLEEAGARRRIRQTTAFINLTEQLAEQYPQSQAAESGVMNLAKAYDGWGKPDKAREWYAAFIEKFPWSWSISEAMYRHAVLGAINNTDSADVEQEFTDVIGRIKSARYKTAALFWQGKLRTETGDTHGASTSFSQAARLDPYSFYGLRARGALTATSDVTPSAIPGALGLSSRFVLLAPQPPTIISRKPGLPDGHMPDPPVLRRMRRYPSIAQRLEVVDLFARNNYEETEWELTSLGQQFGGPESKWAFACVLHNAGAHFRAIRMAETLDALHGSQGYKTRLVFPTAYWHEVVAAASRFKVDPLLIEALMREESRFDAGDVSNAGAIGLMQLMPATARWVAGQGVIKGFTDDMTSDPAVNITLGAWYIANLVNRFDGSIVCAIAGYNAGPGNVDKWVKSNGLPTGDIDRFIEKIPFEETRAYVKRVLRSYAAYKMLHGLQT